MVVLPGSCRWQKNRVGDCGISKSPTRHDAQCLAAKSLRLISCLHIYCSNIESAVPATYRPSWIAQTCRPFRFPPPPPPPPPRDHCCAFAAPSPQYKVMKQIPTHVLIVPCGEQAGRLGTGGPLAGGSAAGAAAVQEPQPAQGLAPFPSLAGGMASQTRFVRSPARGIQSRSASEDMLVRCGLQLCHDIWGGHW